MAKRRVPAVRRHHPPGPLGLSSCRPPPVGRKFTQELLPPTARGRDLFRPWAARPAKAAPLPAARSATTSSHLRAARARRGTPPPLPLRSSVHRGVCRCCSRHLSCPLLSPPAFCPPTLSLSPRAQTPPTSCSLHVLRACHRLLALLRRCQSLGHLWRGCALAPVLAPSPPTPLALRVASSTSVHPLCGSVLATPLHAPASSSRCPSIPQHRRPPCTQVPGSPSSLFSPRERAPCAPAPSNHPRRRRPPQSTGAARHTVLGLAQIP